MSSKKTLQEPGTIVIEYPSGRIEKTECNRYDRKFKAKVDAVNKLIEAGSQIKWYFTKKPQHEIDAEAAAKKKARDDAKKVREGR